MHWFLRSKSPQLTHLSATTYAFPRPFARTPRSRVPAPLCLAPRSYAPPPPWPPPLGARPLLSAALPFLHSLSSLPVAPSCALSLLHTTSSLPHARPLNARSSLAPSPCARPLLHDPLSMSRSQLLHAPSSLPRPLHSAAPLRLCRALLPLYAPSIRPRPHSRALLLLHAVPPPCSATPHDPLFLTRVPPPPPTARPLLTYAGSLVARSRCLATGRGCRVASRRACRMCAPGRPELFLRFVPLASLGPAGRGGSDRWVLGVEQDSPEAEGGRFAPGAPESSRLSSCLS
ncbi:hypothetical protein H8959_010966 [Pygathrix nigripes]